MMSVAIVEEMREEFQAAIIREAYCSSLLRQIAPVSAAMSGVPSATLSLLFMSLVSPVSDVAKYLMCGMKPTELHQLTSISCHFVPGG